MLGPADWVIWMLGTLFEAAVVVCALHRKALRRYFFLNLYMLFSVFVSLGRFQVLLHSGRSSVEYRYFYFYSDALLTIVLYFALISLYLLVFQELHVERYLRMGAVLLLAGTAWFSYAVVSQSSHRMLTHFAFELSQNLYFVGMVLTYVLWGAILKLRETRALLVQFVLSYNLSLPDRCLSVALILGLWLLARCGRCSHRSGAPGGGAAMMAGIILVCSVVLFLQFFVFYCRSLIAVSSKQVLSPEVQDVTGISRTASGEDFARVMQLLQLCPARPEDRKSIQAIGAYFSLLNFLRSTIARMVPSMRVWTESERGHCAYFAAVALERRISFSRDMLAQQMDA